MLTAKPACGVAIAGAKQRPFNVRVSSCPEGGFVCKCVCASVFAHKLCLHILILYLGICVEKDTGERKIVCLLFNIIRIRRLDYSKYRWKLERALGRAHTFAYHKIGR